MNPSNPEGLQGVKFKDLKLLEPHPQKFKQYGRRTKLKSLTEEKEMSNVTTELKKKTKQLDLISFQSYSAGSQQQLEFCKEKQIPEFVFCNQNQPPESKQQETSTCYDVDMDTKQQQETEKVGQVVRRSNRLAKSTEICTLSLDLLPSPESQYHHLGKPELENDKSSIQVEVPQLKMETDYVNLAQKLQQLQLPAADSDQPTKQTEMVKTTKVLHQRAKLRSWQKCCTSHEDIQTARLGSSLALGWTEQVQQEPLCLEYYQQNALKELSVQQQAHTKPPGKTEFTSKTATSAQGPRERPW